MSIGITVTDYKYMGSLPLSDFMIPDEQLIQLLESNQLRELLYPIPGTKKGEFMHEVPVLIDEIEETPVSSEDGGGN